MFKSNILSIVSTTSKLTLEQFKAEYTKCTEAWHKACVNTRGTLESYLGLTFSEFSLISFDIGKAYEQMSNGDLFYIPTIQEIEKLYEEYQSTYSIRSVLRFGQYVYNTVSFEYKNTYYSLNNEECLKTLKEGVEYWNSLKV